MRYWYFDSESLRPHDSNIVSVKIYRQTNVRTDPAKNNVSFDFKVQSAKVRHHNVSFCFFLLVVLLDLWGSASTKRMPNIAYIYSWVTRKIFNITLSYISLSEPTVDPDGTGLAKAAYELFSSPTRYQGHAPCWLRGLLVFTLALIFKRICNYTEQGEDAWFFSLVGSILTHH